MDKYEKTVDLIIKNAKIVDGTGKPAYEGDIAILGDKIDFIGNLDGVKADSVIDAEGKYVTPGFIDNHTHYDQTIWVNGDAQNSLCQGITTEVVGNCGFSMRNDIKIPFDEANGDIECVYDLANTDKKIPKGAFANTFRKLEKMGSSINTAWLCGHNDLRVIADLNTTDYTEEQFAVMEGFLREAMEAGYIGFSTGLEFDPGVMSRPEEVEKLAAVVAEYDGIYTSHMRDEGTYIIEAVEEFLNVIRKTGIRGVISHLNVKYDNGIPNEYLEKTMNMLKDARKNENLDVFTDMLGTTFGIGLAQAMLPPWLYKNGWDKALEILASDEGRSKVKNDMNRYWRFLSDGQWNRLLRIFAPYCPDSVGITFGELCEKWKKDPCDCFLDVLMQAKTIEDIRSTMMVGVMFDEQTMIDSVVKDDIYFWMSDSGEAQADQIQDYMGYLYFFVRYVKELGVISIEKAVNKATARVAEHYRLEKRGKLCEGYYADINIFDLQNLQIHATFDEPCRYCTGMDYVIVNGTPVIYKGEHTGKRTGMILKRR